MIIVKPKTQDETVLVPDGTYDARTLQSDAL